jgi:hypothetical protein
MKSLKEMENEIVSNMQKVIKEQHQENYQEVTFTFMSKPLHLSREMRIRERKPFFIWIRTTLRYPYGANTRKRLSY